MNRSDQLNNLTPRYAPPWWLVGLCVAAMVIGVASMVMSLVSGPSLDFWLWLDVAFVFFVGISNGMLAWAAIFRLTQTRWTPVVNRLGHSVIFFLPFLAVALAVLLCGVRQFAPWVAHPIPEKEAWLNVESMVARDIASLAVLWVFYRVLVRKSLKADARAARGEAIPEKDHYNLTAIAVAAVIMYTITSTIICWDLIMSLSPEWISTMFAPYYFTTNVYVGMAALIILAGFLRKPLGVERYLGPQQFKDMGNLMLGFSLFSMGLFFAQYLTIWYGNLPMETGFLVVRYMKGPWPPLGWAAIILGYAVPFVLLQSRTIKQNPKFSMPIAATAIIGVALDRYVLVVPSLRPDNPALSPLPSLMVLAYLGAFVLAVIGFFRRYPAVSAADAALPEVKVVEVEA